MRVATFGYQTWGHKTLEALIKSNHEVVLAVTHPPSDQPYESIWADSVEELARDHGIPVHLAQRPDDELIERVKPPNPTSSSPTTGARGCRGSCSTCPRTAP